MAATSEVSRINQELIAFREAADLTQTQVAVGMQRIFREAGRSVPPLTKGSVYRWEAGKGISRRNLWALCTLFDAAPQQLGFQGVPDPRRTEPLHSSDESRREGAEVPTRRDVIRRAASLGAAVAVPQSAMLLAEQIARALENPRTITVPLLDELVVTVGTYRQRFADTAPGALLPMVRRKLGDVAALLEGPHLSLHHRQLCGVTGKLSGLAGRLSIDLQDPAAAQSYFSTGLRLSKEAEDSGLTAYLLEATTWLPPNDNPQLSVGILERSNWLAANAPGAERAFLAARAAEESAAAGDGPAARRWMTRAEHLTGSERNGTDGWTFRWSESTLRLFQGRCLLRLGEPLEAARTLAEGTRTLPQAAVRSRAIGTADLATAYVRQGEVEEGCRLSNETLDLVDRLPASAAVDAIRSLRMELAPVAGKAEVRELDERLQLV